MAFTKGDLMKLTGNDNSVDSAIPEKLVDEMKRLGFNASDVIYAIAYSYKDNSFGIPINLSLEFIKLLENTKIEVMNNEGLMVTKEMNYTLADFMLSYLTNTDRWELRIK
jgi:hypothetical protein